jgi:hypothetical protein
LYSTWRSSTLTTAGVADPTCLKFTKTARDKRRGRAWYCETVFVREEDNKKT